MSIKRDRNATYVEAQQRTHLGWREVAPVIVAVVVVLVCGGVVLQSLSASAEYYAEIESIDHALGATGQFLLQFDYADAFLRAYLLTADADCLRRFHEARDLIVSSFEDMKAALAGSGYDAELRPIEGELNARLSGMDQAAAPGTDRETARRQYDTANLGPAAFRATIAGIDGRQRARHLHAGAELRRYRLLAVPVGLGGALAVLILLLWEFLALRVSFGRIRALMRKIAAGEKGFHLFSLKLQQQRETDAAEIARRVHDDLGQALTVIKLDANRAGRLLATQPDRAAALLETIQSTADATAQSARNIAMELRPPILDQLGIVAALEWQLGELRPRTSTEFQFRYPEEELPLQPAHQTAMFRVAQEAFTNILRHANARRVEVVLSRRPLAVVLEISDDGAGIPEARLEDPYSLGLIGMQERAAAVGATLDIISEEGRGVTVRLSVPVRQSAAAAS